MTNQSPAGPVPRRRWGKSNLSIPVIPYGTQGFGNHFGDVAGEAATGLIHQAIDRGVSLLAIALQFCLAEGRIQGNPLGNQNPSDLQQNVEAVATPLPAGVLEEFQTANL